MASEWAEMYTSALAQGEGFSRTQKEMIANALDATRDRFLREGRIAGLREAARILPSAGTIYSWVEKDKLRQQANALAKKARER